MLVVIRGELVRAKVQGLSTADMLETEPADGLAQPNANTADWLTRAYGEYVN